jgi:hypothetical protein
MALARRERGARSPSRRPRSIPGWSDICIKVARRSAVTSRVLVSRGQRVNRGDVVALLRSGTLHPVGRRGRRSTCRRRAIAYAGARDNRSNRRAAKFSGAGGADSRPSAVGPMPPSPRGPMRRCRPSRLAEAARADADVRVAQALRRGAAGRLRRSVRWRMRSFTLPKPHATSREARAAKILRARRRGDRIVPEVGGLSSPGETVLTLRPTAAVVRLQCAGGCAARPRSAPGSVAVQARLRPRGGDAQLG